MGSRLCLVCAAATIAAGRARLLPEGITYRREFDYEFGELRAGEAACLLRRYASCVVFLRRDCSLCTASWRPSRRVFSFLESLAPTQGHRVELCFNYSLPISLPPKRTCWQCGTYPSVPFLLR